MTLVQTAQIIGTISILLLFCIKFYIAITIGGSKALSAEQKVKHLIALILWTALYFLSLSVLRLFLLLGIGTIEQLRIVGGFSAVIPLGGVVFNLWIVRKLDGTQKDV